MIETKAKNEKKVVLCILDGWGIGPDSENNPMTLAHLPTWSFLKRHALFRSLEASGKAVGLPEQQPGNSEVGHITLGTGRIIWQDLPRLTHLFKDNQLPSLPAWQTFIKKMHQGTRRIHVLGLLSPGGAHSHQDHLKAVLSELQKDKEAIIYVHAFLDGRDTPPQSGYGFLDSFLQWIRPFPNVRLATFGGRYFAMDRDHRWDRIRLAYEAIRYGQAPLSLNPLMTLSHFYDLDRSDEFIPPHVCHHIYPEDLDLPFQGMEDGDSFIMINFRPDRVRQILSLFLSPSSLSDAPLLEHSSVLLSGVLGLSSYGMDDKIPPLISKDPNGHSLGEILSQKGMRQLRLAETEKYAHVTFFFNGGEEAPFPGEDRILIPSPPVATYDLAPAMSAGELTAALVKAIQSQEYGVIVVNYANADMVGHTGQKEAIIAALESIDRCLSDLLEHCRQTETVLILTADHGNAEQCLDPEGHPHTAHTLNPVPFMIYPAPESMGFCTDKAGLQDVAPTLLDLLGMAPPVEMTGRSLLRPL